MKKDDRYTCSPWPYFIVFNLGATTTTTTTENNLIIAGELTFIEIL